MLVAAAADFEVVEERAAKEGLMGARRSKKTVSTPRFELDGDVDLYEKTAISCSRSSKSNFAP